MNFTNGVAQRVEDVIDNHEKVGFVIETSCVKVTHIDDIRTRQKQLGEAITLLIRNFESQTLCPVRGIEQLGGLPTWRAKVGL